MHPGVPRKGSDSDSLRGGRRPPKSGPPRVQAWGRPPQKGDPSAALNEVEVSIFVSL